MLCSYSGQRKHKFENRRLKTTDFCRLITHKNYPHAKILLHRIHQDLLLIFVCIDSVTRLRPCMHWWDVVLKQLCSLI